ncbi:MAG: hypothetical protein ACRDJM_10210 [Actinomycetota bacterium]
MLLALSVLLCMAVPMSSAGMSGGRLMAVFCCFVLATIGLSFFCLHNPGVAILLRSIGIRQPQTARGDPPRRPPDLSILGTLLI